MNQTRDTLAVCDVADVGAQIGLTRRGNAVPTERFPAVALRSPDGLFALVDAYYVGDNLPDTIPSTPRGTVE